MATLGLPPPAAAAKGHASNRDISGLKHYEQTTQAMAMKDRRRPAKKKAQRGVNPNEVAIPDGLKTDEKDKLLQEIKKKWQADFGQRIRYEEANRALREQVTKLTARVSELESGPTTGGPSSQVSDPNAPPRTDAPHAAGNPKSTALANARLRRTDAQLKRALAAAGKQLPPGASGSTGAGPPASLVGQEDNILRQTNVIVVLTKRNKELVSERKKLEDLVHAKTLVAEGEVKRAEKLQHQLDLERNKAVRDRTKAESHLVELQKQKAQVDETVRELQRKLEYMSRVRLALEHQVSGLREKLDSLMIDYSDVVTAIPDEDDIGSPGQTRKKVKEPNASESDDDKVKQARLALEYETWVTKKKEETNHMYPGMTGAARSRKGTKDAHHASDKDAKAHAAAEEKKRTAEVAAAAAEAERKRQAEEEAVRQQKEAEELARLQKEAEEREKERQRLAEEELAKQQAEEEERAVQEAAEREAEEKAKGGKKKKK